MKCEIVHESMFLPELIRKTTTGRILMPDHGLDNHWDQQAMLELLNSIRKGFPIGTLTLYHTAEPGPWVNHAGPTTVPTRVSGSALYVMDGTERIRTIMGLLGPADDDDRIIDDIDWRIYYDLDTGEFRRRRYGREQAQDIPVRTVLNTNDFLTAGHEVNSGTTDPDKAATRLQEADRLASAFRDYPVSITRVSGTNWTMARQVYQQVNATGRHPRPKAEQEFGLEPTDTGLRAAVETARRQLAEAGRPDLPNTVIVQCMHLSDHAENLDRNTIQLNDWRGNRKIYDRWIPATVNGLLEALGFLERFGVDDEHLLPYEVQLLLLGDFFRQRARNPPPVDRMPTDQTTDQLDQTVDQRLEYWFWATSFSAWFGRTGSSEIRETVHRLHRLAADGSSDVPLLEPRTATAFPERFNPDSARCRAFLLYLKTLQPRAGDQLTKRGTGPSATNTPRQASPIVTNHTRARHLQESPANFVLADGLEPAPTWKRLQSKDDPSPERTARIHGFGPNWKAHVDSDSPGRFLEDRRDHLINAERIFIDTKQMILPTTTTSPAVSDTRVAATR